MTLRYGLSAGMVALGMVALASFAHAKDPAIIYFPVADEKPAERHMTGLFCLTADDTNIAARNYHIMGLSAALALANKDKVTCVLHQSGVSGVIVTNMKLVRHEYIDMRKLYLYEATVSGFYFGAKRIELMKDGKPEAMKQYIFMTGPQNPNDDGDDS